MWTVDEYEVIRRMHLVEGLSQREVGRRLHHSRKTVAKAIANPIPPGYRRKSPPEWPVIDRVRGMIDAWLKQDQALPRKQRHMAQHVYERLRDDYKLQGDPSTVRRYVALARDQQRRSSCRWPSSREKRGRWAGMRGMSRIGENWSRSSSSA